MKTFLYTTLFIILNTFIGYSQIISINDEVFPESKQSLEQLVTDVLISSNCSTVDNFKPKVYGEPDDFESKSYGYFKRPEGSTFPFEEGVVLTTGKAFPAGNNRIDDIINNYNGDPNNNDDDGDDDLEEALSQVDTQDATYIKFNFTPQVETFSFRFLMASEEYNGSDECLFSDSFAFLLREVGTTSYTNLAVLPDGVPVSVTNINNSSLIPDNPTDPNDDHKCDSHIEFFAGYNVGHTNYGGRTVALTASSTVTPGVTYEIKLVVADQGDSQYDSAIFLEGGSFNIGGDLGEDYKISTNNPGCKGSKVDLDANLSIAGATFKWFKNGVEIEDETDSTLSVRTDGTYSYEATFSGCSSSDEIIVEFTTPPIIATAPKDILVCESDGNSKEEFDFSENEALILGSQLSTSFPISYHKDQTDAEANLEPFSIPYENTLAQETIWMRIADTTQTCFLVTSFNIEVSDLPTANTPIDFEICDTSEDGDDTNEKATFDLSKKMNEVYKSQSTTDYNVKFYYSQSAADEAVEGSEILNPIQNSSNPQTIFARIEKKSKADCYSTTSFKLIVNPLPEVEAEVTLTQCDDDEDGISKFNLTEANRLISKDFENEKFTYYLTNLQAIEGNVSDQITNFTNYPNPTVTNSHVYARIETENDCYRTSKINLVVAATSISEAFKLEYSVCDDAQIDSDDSNGVAAFDFSDATAKVLGQLPTGQDLTVSYYTSEDDALAETNPIPDISNHRNTSNPNIQQIYVRVDSNDVNACLGLGNYITLTVDPLPNKNTISNYDLCSTTNQATFDLSTKNSEVLGSQTDPILISYHLSMQDAIDNNPIPSASNYKNISNPQTIYIRSQFDLNNNNTSDPGECVRTDMSFKLQVNLNPVLVTPDPIQLCSDQIQTEFDLTIRKDQITNGDDTIVLSYFETQTDLDNNNPIPIPTRHTINSLTETVIVLARGSNECTTQINLELQTILYANLSSAPDLEECEIDNNGYDYFDLTLRISDIFNGLDATDFEVRYYENEMAAIEGNSDMIQVPTNFLNTQINTQTIYIRVKPKSNECFQIIPLKLIVNPVPEIDLPLEHVICLNKNDAVIDPENTPLLQTTPIDTGLNNTEYLFQWYRGTIDEVNSNPENALIMGATNPYFSPVSAGVYTIFAKNKLSGCRIPASTTVLESYPPEMISTELLTFAFSENNIIEVTVEGNGTYEYRIDDGPWQTGTRFENVTIGEHRLFVRDLYNCNSLSDKKVVIGYNKFFTPNGDGYHDTWNIIGIEGRNNVKTYIFDRYGKLLKLINSSENGWDGTHGGVLMPTGDYWFKLEFLEPKTNMLKEFSSHFTLKR